MGKYFSDAVDKAIEDIYYCYDPQRAMAAMASLAKASNDGDGDASYVLSRCLSGPQYSWAYHPFVEDDQGVERLIQRSIRMGSAIGILGSMRCGMLTPEMEEEALKHFPSLEAAWKSVYEKAEAGSPFCQNMIGNTYFWLDTLRIQNKGASDFPSREAFGQFLKEEELRSLTWFDKAFRGGMGFAGRNMYNLYHDGDKDFDIQPQPEKARAVAKLGAELGYPEWQERYGKLLQDEKGREHEALEWCQKAVEQGQLSAWYNVGKAYQFGKGVNKDAKKALECYEAGLEDPNSTGCANMAGQLYYLGQDGVPQDYARAVQLFEMAHKNGNTWGNDMLGLCYVLGKGCEMDFERALTLFNEVKYSSDERNYGLGLIYAEGLGVPEDIKKGVEYLQKAPNYKPAQEALLGYKKTLFGRWVRRKK